MESQPRQMTRAERAAVVELLAEELARGWIPTPADIEAALHVVRSTAVEAASAHRVVV